jgi:hypothetical protein
MCGIAGILSFDGRIDRDVLRRMTDALRHRGPDDEGFHIDTTPERGAGIGLGFRRLSIIDLEGGHQPMSNEDGTVWLIFNGEIYNFQDLRPDLERRGHIFRTRSDTETVVHLWEEYGPNCVDKLNGMYGFALWDAKRRRSSSPATAWARSRSIGPTPDARSCLDPSSRRCCSIPTAAATSIPARWRSICRTSTCRHPIRSSAASTSCRRRTPCSGSAAARR